ncbi:hypothetical protein SDC9_150849 [bioreactor metagenome]|uniref:Uncharacterized protein n=1 Tax=bioreactor metagenome TaxID=1076179 RepID=A0A645ENM4_9ZZZZ
MVDVVGQRAQTIDQQPLIGAIRVVDDGVEGFRIEIDDRRREQAETLRVDPVDDVGRLALQQETDMEFAMLADALEQLGQPGNPDAEEAARLGKVLAQQAQAGQHAGRRGQQAFFRRDADDGQRFLGDFDVFQRPAVLGPGEDLDRIVQQALLDGVAKRNVASQGQFEKIGFQLAELGPALAGKFQRDDAGGFLGLCRDTRRQVIDGGGATHLGDFQWQ